MSGKQTEAQIRLLLVEDMPQVANYIRSLLDTQTKIKLLEVVRDGRYLEATDRVLKQHGGLWFNDETYVISRRRA